MNHEHASDIVRQLADGLDPTTGEPFPDDSPYQHPRIVRALFVAQQALDGAARRDARARPRAEHAGLPWSDDDDRRLAAAHDEGASVRDLAERHGRSVGAIQARLVRLGKIPAAKSRFRV